MLTEKCLILWGLNEDKERGKEGLLLSACIINTWIIKFL